MRCMTSIGQRIKALRKAKVPAGTQKDLAAGAGIDQSTVSDIERGHGFSAEILLSLADALQVSPHYIMRGGDEESFAEEQLIAHYRACHETDRANLLNIAQALAARSAANPFPTPTRAR